MLLQLARPSHYEVLQLHSSAELQLGDLNPDFIELTHNLAVFYHEIGKPHTALALDQRCLTLATAIGMHECALKSEHCLAQVYVSMGMMENALECALNCARDSTRLLGPQHALTVQCLRLLTLCDQV